MLTVSTCTRVTATLFVLLVLLEIDLLAIGFVSLAILLARPVSTILASVLVVLTEWATSRPQLLLNLVSLVVSMELTPMLECVRFVTSSVEPVLGLPLTVSLALLTRSSIEEAAGLSVLLFLSRESDKTLHALTLAPMVTTRLH